MSIATAVSSMVNISKHGYPIPVRIR